MKLSYSCVLLVLTSTLFVGCELTPEGKQYFEWGKKKWQEISALTLDPDPQPSKVPDESILKSAAAKAAQANAEILHEIFQVVYIREPKDRAEFGSLVDSLNQGASYEGIYNGLVHSVDYKKLEAPGRSASAEALQAFSEELAYLEAELPKPSGPPVLAIEAKEEPNPNPTISAGPEISPQMLRSLRDKNIREYVGSNVFVLKRILGDGALKVIDAKDEYPEKLALWYSKWVVRLAQRNIDFGIPLRNKADEAFHYKWAIETTADRIRWEVLNRVHRILNEANRQKQ